MSQSTEFINETVKLKIWYAKWLNYIGITLDNVFPRHIDLYQHTSFDNGDWRSRKERSNCDPQWQKILTNIKNIIMEHDLHPGLFSTKELEDKCFEVLRYIYKMCMRNKKLRAHLNKQRK